MRVVSKYLLLSFLLFAVLSETAVAKSHLLVTIRSDVDSSEIHELRVETNDEGVITHFYTIELNSLDKKVFDVEKATKGIDLLEVDDRTVISMKSSDFMMNSGGFFKIKYLTNGLLNSSKSFEVKVENENEKWSIFKKGRKIRSFFIRGRSIFGKVIGIKRIDLTYFTEMVFTD